MQTKGLASFYKGFKMALIATIASWGSYFFWYRFWKNVCTQIFKVRRLVSKHILVITAIAGATSSACSNPFWVIHTRMAIAKQKKMSVLEAAAEVHRNEGFSAFFKGVLPQIILVINPIINFVVYEFLKKWLLDRKRVVGAREIFIISSIGKILATLCTYPICSIRTKMQANKSNKSIFKLLEDTSLLDLYKGLPAKFIQTILQNAFLLLTYEKLRAVIKFLTFR